MLDTLIDELRATRSDDRSRAAADWATGKNRTRLKVLAATYRSSPDELLRRLAIEADDYQRKDPHVPTELVSEDMDSLANAVNTFVLTGDRVRALDYLNTAVNANPAWREDVVVADFAGMLMQMPPEQAIAMLGVPGSERAFSIARGARWWEQKEIERQNINRRTVSIRLLVYAVIAALGIAAILWVFTQVWIPIATRGLAIRATDTAFANTLRELARDTGDRLPVIAIGGGLLLAVELVIRAYAFHLLSAMPDAVPGAFLYLLHRLTTLQIALVLAVALVGCALLLLSADTLNSATATGFDNEWAAFGGRLYVVVVVSVVAYVVLTTRLLMESYRSGVGGGCFTLFVGTLIAAIVVGILAALGQSILDRLLAR